MSKSVDGPKHPGGRPPFFRTAGELQVAIDAFFADADKKKEPYTITGLTLALGFLDRKALLEYVDRGEEFSATVKNAKTRVENWLEKRAAASSGVVAGVIFNLKNNFGWKDEKQLEVKDPDGFFQRETLTIEIVDGSPTEPQAKDSV